MATTMQIMNPISPINFISVKFCYPNPQFNPIPTRKSTITCAKTTKKLFLTSNQSRKTLISLARFAASNLHHVLPAPFNSVIRELNIDGGGSGGRNGGSGGSWNRFRWGGFDGGGGRKRKPNKKFSFWFWGFVTVCCLGVGFWMLVLGGEIQLEVRNEAVLAALCLSMFLVLVRNGLVPEWVLGFCGGGVFVGLLLNKKDELKKFVARRRRRRHMRIK